MIRDLFGTNELFDWDLVKLVSRLGLDLVFTWLVVGRVYRRRYPDNRDFILTYYVFNVITFSLCMLLRKVPLELGFAMGLFAVFGILRYRTEQIAAKDLTYLFIVIGIAILNAVANKKVSLIELLAVNALIVAITIGTEWRHARALDQTRVLYDKLSLLQPGRQEELHADLAIRMGLPVTRVHIIRIDLLHDSAELIAYFPRPQPEPRSRASTGD